MMNEGYVKFNCDLVKEDIVSAAEISEMNIFRTLLWKLHLIGAYPGNLGFGNISARHGASHEFLISGTQTGTFETLETLQYALVTEYDFARNSLVCHGCIGASSESLTHAAVYESSPQINAIAHIHSLSFWEAALSRCPTTREDVEYGTPEMAMEIKRLFIEEAEVKHGVIVMAGHREGCVLFSENFSGLRLIMQEQFHRILGWGNSVWSESQELSLCKG